MTWDAIVIGSGFGGAMAAWPLVHAGQRVLMLERGGWVARGPQNWDDAGAGLITPHYTKESPYAVTADRRQYEAGAWNCVGGQSVFYGGASYRFRESDFAHKDAIVGNSGAQWPFTYSDIEPWYLEAERLLGVAGETSGQVGEPLRSAPYPHAAAPLSDSACAMANAARRRGMTPSRIPLAISFDGREAPRACMRCGNCDGYACAAEAKNDLATGVIPQLIRRGMTVRANTVCVRIVREGSRVAGIEYVDRISGEKGTVLARNVILAAGTMATPHLLFASNLVDVNPARDAVGRYLTRHCNAIVFGVFLRPPNPTRAFDKQIAVLDLYEEAGSIQQLSPPLGLVRAYLPPGLRSAGARLVSHSSALLVIAEDQPNRDNRLSVNWSITDRFGLPQLEIRHRYSARDRTAARMLISAAKGILREAGALLHCVHRIDTFSHALGTVRMGPDSRSAPVDISGRYRGIDNLYVVDGSVLPRSAGLNPSLTIAANALRVGAELARATPPITGRVLRTLTEFTPASSSLS